MPADPAVPAHRAWARAHLGLRIAHVGLSVWGPLQLLLLIGLLLSVELQTPASVLGLFAAVTLSWVALVAWAVGLGLSAAGPLSTGGRVWAVLGAVAALVYIPTSYLAWEPYSLAVTLCAAPGMALRAGVTDLPDAVRRAARHTLGAVLVTAALALALRALEASELPGLAAAARGVLGLVAVGTWLLLLRVVRGLRIAVGRQAGVRERFDG